eukprot:g40915.t1
MVQGPKKKESNWTPPEGRCPGLVMFAQDIRGCVITRVISHAHKEVPNVTQAQCNAICALKTNRNTVIKQADKGGAIVIQNRTDYCKEVYRQLNNQEHYRRPPKNCNDLLRRWTQDMTDRVLFVIQYFPGAEKLCHVLRSPQHVIDDNEHLTKASPRLHFSPLNNRQTLNRPSFAANYPAFRTTSTTTLYNPVMASSARH